MPDFEIINEIRAEIGYTFPENTRFEKAENTGNENVGKENGASGLRIERKNGVLTVRYARESDLARAALLIKAHGKNKKGNFCIEDKRIFEELCFLVDCSRNGVLSVAAAKKYIRNLSMLGYNAMMLYTEDTYEIDGEPIFGYLRGRYTKAELKEIDVYAEKWGIEMIPCIQTLAHLNALRRWYADYEDLFDIDDILLAGDERVYALIEKMFQTTSECFSSRRIHIGMDEAHNVGRGAYLDKNGYKNAFEVLSSHLQRVAEIAAKYGYRALMWSDMFLNLANRERRRLDENGNALIPQDIFDKIPANVSVCHWDYGAFSSENYLHRFKMHEGFKNPVWMAVSSYKIGGFAPGNAYSEIEMETAFSACREYNMSRIINCSWNDGGAEASQFSNLPSVANVSRYAYGKTRAQMKREFLALTGYTYEAFEKLEWPDNGCGKYSEDHVRVSKVMLYNDPLAGQMDKEADPGYTSCFFRAEKALARSAKGQYDYIFKNMAQISRVMQLKYELGARLRKAYAAKDKEALRLIADDMSEIVRCIAKFIQTLKKQWMTELKPYGFEIQEYRLGGVSERIRGCKERVLEYVNGKAERIPELEETIYADAWLGRNERTGRMGYNSFELIASVNKF